MSFPSQNTPKSMSAVALPQTPLGELTALPQTPYIAGFAAGVGWRGGEKRTRERGRGGGMERGIPGDSSQRAAQP